MVVVGNIPEHGLVVAGTRRLVQRIDYLLEIVGDNLVDGALLQAEVGLFVDTLPVIESILLADEVVHVHQELRGGTCPAEHGADHEHHIDKAAAERLEVSGSGRVAANAGGAANEPGVHRDRGTVVGQTCLIVLINKMVRQHIDVLVGECFSVHLFDAVGQQSAVQADKIGFGQFTNERGNIFVLHVGISVIF